MLKLQLFSFFSSFIIFSSPLSKMQSDLLSAFNNRNVKKIERYLDAQLEVETPFSHSPHEWDSLESAKKVLQQFFQFSGPLQYSTTLHQGQSIGGLSGYIIFSVSAPNKNYRVFVDYYYPDKQTIKIRYIRVEKDSGLL